MRDGRCYLRVVALISKILKLGEAGNVVTVERLILRLGVLSAVSNCFNLRLVKFFTTQAPQPEIFQHAIIMLNIIYNFHKLASIIFITNEYHTH